MLLRYLFAALLLILFAYVTFRIIVRNDYSNKGRLTSVSYSFEVLVFALHANFMYLFLPTKWPNFPSISENIILRIIAIVFIIIGILIVAISMSGLGYGRTMGQDKILLNTSGLYKYSRNPQVIGYGMILIAVVVLYLSWFSIGWLIIYFVISYFMINTEEEFLTNTYKEEYEKYCADVPRLFKLF